MKDIRASKMHFFSNQSRNSSTKSLTVDSYSYLFIGILFLTFLTLILSIRPAFGAGGDIIWQFGDSQSDKQEAMASVSDSQDNIIITGYSLNSSEDFYTTKITAPGDTPSVAWSSTFDRAGGDDRALAIAVDGNDDIIVAGYADNGMNTDFHTIKICGVTRAEPIACTAGDTIWQHSFNGPGNGHDYAVAAVVDNLNNLYIGGYTQGSAGSDDFMVVKYSPNGPQANGQPLWIKTHDGAAGSEDRITDIAVKNNVLAVTGYSQNDKTVPDFDVLTIKYDLNGNIDWQKIYDGGFGDDRGWQVNIDSLDNVIVSASSYNGSTKEIYTVKYNAVDGSEKWQRIYNGGNLSEPQGLALDIDGDVYIVGVTFTALGKNDFYTARYDQVDGSIVWEKIFDSGNDNIDIPTDIDLDETGDVFVTGYTHKDLTGDDDFQTIKYKKDNGNLLWQSMFDGPGGGNDQAVGMTVGVNISSSGDIYVAGWSDQLPGGQSDYDYYAVKYDAGLLNPPSNLSASTLSNTDILLQWTDNSSNEENFIIERCTGIDCSNFTYLTTAEADSTSYSDTSIPPHHWYSYRIKATNSTVGDSHFSNIASALATVVTYDQPNWIYTYNGPENADDHAYAIATGLQNNPVVTGSRLSPNLGSGGFDYYTVKLDRSDASELWNALYNDPDDELDVATCLSIDPNNDVIVSGYSSLYGGGGANTNDIYTLKYDADGPLPFGDPHIWGDQYNGPSGDDDRSSSIDTATDSSGNIVVTGYGRNTNNDDDIYLLKYQSDGTRLWAATPFNGGGHDYPGDVIFASDGNVFVSGTTYNTTNLNYDHYLRKYSTTDGSPIWTVINDYANGDDELNDVVTDLAGNVYVVGYVTNATGNTDIYVNKYDGSNGAELWAAKIINGAGDAYDEAVSIKYDKNRNEVIVGASQTAATSSVDFVLFRYATDGTLLWQQTLDRSTSDDFAKTLGIDTDGNVCITGDTDNGNNSDVLALCYDAYGNLTGSLLYNGTADDEDYAEDVAVNGYGEMFVAGATTNSAGNTDYLVLRSDPKVMLTPAPFNVVPLYSSITLQWGDNTLIEDGFYLWRKTGPCSSQNQFQQLPDLAANQTSFVDTGLTPGDTYCYRMQAFTSAGQTSPMTEEIETTTLIPQISNCNATSVNTTTIDLSWDDQTEGETGFEISYCTGFDCSDFSNPRLANADSQSFSDTEACEGSIYSYRIEAIGNGWSTVCTINNISPISVTPATIDLTDRITEARVDISWLDTNTDLTGYRIYRCEGPGCTPPSGVGNELTSIDAFTMNETVLLKMEETLWDGSTDEVIDASGNSNHATSYNGAATDAAGHTGRGGLFDGNNDYIQWAYAGAFPTNNFSMAAWVKATTGHQIDAQNSTGTAGTGGQRYIFGAENRGADAGAGVSVGTNGISVYEHGSSYMPPIAVYNGSIGTGWNHIVVTYTERQPRIYLNGTLVHTGLLSPRNTVYAPIKAGGGTYGYFPGNLDDVKIFDRALTADEITAVYDVNRKFYTDPSVAPNKTYRYSVSSYKDATCEWESTPSNIGEAITTLTDPCPLLASDLNTSEVSLGWQDTFASETGYTIDRCIGLNCDFSTIDATFPIGSDTTQYIDTSACPDIDYTYRVKAERTTSPTWNSSYCESTVSMSATTAPTGLIANRLSEQQVTLNWQDTTGDETGFEVDRCEGASCDFSTKTTIAIGADTTNYVNSGLQNNTTYRYRISAVKDGACGWPTAYDGPVAAATSFLPPSGLTAKTINSTTIDLSWADINITETGYIIERCAGLNCETFSELTTVAADQIYYSDTSVCADTLYRYQLKATNATETSVASEIAETTTFQASSPDSLTVDPKTESSVELSWDDNTIDENGFTVERCDDTETNCLQDPDNNFSPAGDVPTDSFTNVPTGQVLLYHFDEASWGYNVIGDIKDSSINNLHATAYNGANSVTDSINGKAANLDGSNDYILIGNHAQIKITGDQTISMWLKPTDFASRRNAYDKEYGGSGAITIETNGTANYYYGISGYNGGTHQAFNMPSPLIPGIWTHLTIVRDLTSMKLRWYKNGSLITETDALYAAALAGNYTAYIGYGTAGRFKGKIDEFSMWDRALTAEEVYAEYENFKTQLILHMDENSWDGTPGEVIDSSGRNNHGTAYDLANITTAGRYQNGGIFSGSDDHINLGDIDPMDSPDEFTISLWFNRNSNVAIPTGHGVDNVLIAQASDITNDNLEIGTQGTSIEFYLDSLNGTNGNKTVDANIQDQTWYHLGFVYNGSNGDGVKLFIDGQLAGQWTDYAGPLNSSSTSPLSLGISRPDGSLWGEYNGIIDEVEIYTRAFSDNEIRRKAQAWYTDTGLLLNSIYTYRVTAYKNAFCQWDSSLLYSNTYEITTPAPAEPDALTVTSVGTNTVTLQWNDNTGSETEFIIQRCQGIDCTNFQEIDRVSADTTVYTDKPMCQPDSYSYQVLATDGVWTTVPSNEATTSLLSPVAPVDFTAASLSETEISLAWSDNMSGPQTGYRLDRCTGGCSVWDPVADIIIPPDGFDSNISSATWAVNGSLQTVSASSLPININDASGSVSLDWIDGEVELHTISNNVSDTGYNSASLRLLQPGTLSNDDFDLQIDYRLPNGPIVNAEYHVYARMQINFDNGDFVFAERNGNNHHGKISINSVDASGSNAFLADSGKLRITRQANVISTYFWNNGWVNLSTHGTALPVSVSPNYVGIAQYARRNANQDLLAMIDNMVIEGTWPLGYTDTGLDHSTPYTYRVYPFKETCEWPNYAAQDSATTTIQAPSGLTVDNVTTTEIALSWTDTTSSETDFILERCTGTDCSFSSPITFTVGPDTTSYTDTTALPNNTYSYRIFAKNTIDPAPWSSPYSTALINTDTLLFDQDTDKPTNLIVTRIAENQLDLTWQDNTDDESGFIIERTDASCDFTTPQATFNVGQDIVAFSDTDAALQVNTAYCYRLKAYKDNMDPGPGNNSWQTDYSNNSSDFTTVLPPDGLIADPLNTTEIVLNWNDNTVTETGFEIERCTGLGCGNFSPLATAPANATVYTDTTACNGTDYEYQVRAVNGATWQSGFTLPANATTTSALQPANFTASTSAIDSIELSWQDDYTDETLFEIENCSGENCSTFLPLDTVPTDSTSYIDNGHLPSSSFCYQIRARKDSATCAWQTDWATVCKTTLMNGPTDLTAAAVNSMQVKLDWLDNSADEDGFVIEELIWNGRWAEVGRTLQDAETYTTIFGIEENTSYTFRVRAYRNNDFSDPSNEASETTPVRGQGDTTCPQ